MQVVLTNGMPRSGSTWLYNALRHILSQFTEPEDFLCGWHDDIKERRKVNLIKAHGIDHRLLSEATYIFYSYRDIRDVLASRKRMWGMEPTMDVARGLATESQFFDKAAHYIMRHEDFLLNPRKIVEDIAAQLGVTVDIDKVMAELSADKKPASDGKPYNKEELYHEGHVTNGKHMAFKGVVCDKLIKRIEDSFGDWFTERGYSLVSK